MIQLGSKQSQSQEITLESGKLEEQSEISTLKKYTNNHQTKSIFNRSSPIGIIIFLIIMALLLILLFIFLSITVQEKVEINKEITTLTTTQRKVEIDQKITTQATTQQKEVVFQINTSSNVTAFFLTCCQRYDILHQGLKLFAQNNDYPVRQIIVVNDGPLTKELVNNLAIFRDIRVFATGQKVGQIMAIDLGYRFVKTPYVYYTQDDMHLVKKGVIKMNIKKLEQDPTLLQVWNNKQFYNYFILDEQGYVDPVKSEWSAFSFSPTVNRMDVYRQLENGYTGITKNASYGVGTGNTQFVINLFYKNLNYRVWQSPQFSTIHPGTEKGRRTSNPYIYKDQNQPKTIAKEEAENFLKLKQKQKQQKKLIEEIKNQKN